MGAVRQTRTPEFLALNPHGEAPVWVEPGGYVLRESLAILHYLERAYDAPLLYRGDAREEGRILQAMYELERLRAAYRPLERLFLGVEALTEEELQRAAAAPERVYAELEHWAHLLKGGGPFVMGDALTLIDCMLWPVLGYQVRRGLEEAD